MTDADPFDLARFVAAQGPVYATALAELRAGAKRSHWMWFVFPQLRGLGRSPTAQHYGITGLAEARAYLAHPVLGPRLTECTETLTGLASGTLRGILGTPDDLKLRSSMTLFDVADGRPATPFRRALDRWCDGRPDPQTLALLGR